MHVKKEVFNLATQAIALAINATAVSFLATAAVITWAIANRPRFGGHK